MNIGLRGLCVAVGLTATGAAAECFDKRDLGRGLDIEMEAGNAFTVRRERDGTVSVFEQFVNGDPPVLFSSEYGVFMLEEVHMPGGIADEESRLVIDFGAFRDAIPEPAPGLDWTAETTNVFADGYQRPEILTAQAEEMETIALSGCDYDLLPVSLRYQWPDEGRGMSLTYAYLPQIGAGFLMDVVEDGGEPGRNLAVVLRRSQK